MVRCDRESGLEETSENETCWLFSGETSKVEKGALGEKLVLKRLNMLISEMGSEPGGRSCGFGLERLEHVQSKQRKLTWDVEFVTKGSSSLWKTCCDV